MSFNFSQKKKKEMCLLISISLLVINVIIFSFFNAIITHIQTRIHRISSELIIHKFDLDLSGDNVHVSL